MMFIRTSVVKNLETTSRDELSYWRLLVTYRSTYTFCEIKFRIVVMTEYESGACLVSARTISSGQAAFQAVNLER
jgi:hypothetical protein